MEEIITVIYKVYKGMTGKNIYDLLGWRWGPLEELPTHDVIILYILRVHPLLQHLVVGAGSETFRCLEMI